MFKGEGLDAVALSGYVSTGFALYGVPTVGVRSHGAVVESGVTALGLVREPGRDAFYRDGRRGVAAQVAFERANFVKPGDHFISCQLLKPVGFKLSMGQLD
jgi:hypothetical protein